MSVIDVDPKVYGVARMLNNNKNNFLVERLCTVCDLITFLFALVFGKHTDNSVSEGVDYANVVMDAIRNPFKPRSSDEIVLGIIAFWDSSREKRRADATVISGFRNAGDYVDTPRLNLGIYMVHAILELSYDLSDEVFNPPTVVALKSDLVSYNKEPALEESLHNIIVCIMNELKCGLRTLRMEDIHRSTRNKCLILWTEIPSWGPETEVIASLYLHDIANSVGGI
ncbi:uncharacterized protein EV420DRAFT_1649138 [Desarmillaria tabescens]|uniref:Uncharacterized protein n=1 Tax=Armillaria tabescens TaxID=1929756 RepID=A0AA39MS00_ARMTA|nr:uncharacterized protein EV420DRAFT_1649138 [Desarmillaria tabescens]KAK0443675.1 hypothetical protein EV420DRAFT_1649138 [Desarmillaria tabescens]